MNKAYQFLFYFTFEFTLKSHWKPDVIRHFSVISPFRFSIIPLRKPDSSLPSPLSFWKSHYINNSLLLFNSTCAPYVPPLGIFQVRPAGLLLSSRVTRPGLNHLLQGRWKHTEPWVKHMWLDLFFSPCLQLSFHCDGKKWIIGLKISEMGSHEGDWYGFIRRVIIEISV